MIIRCSPARRVSGRPLTEEKGGGVRFAASGVGGFAMPRDDDPLLKLLKRDARSFKGVESAVGMAKGSGLC